MAILLLHSLCVVEDAKLALIQFLNNAALFNGVQKAVDEPCELEEEKDRQGTSILLP